MTAPDTVAFRAQLDKWVATVDRRARSLFGNVVDAAHRSIVYGSPLTGAPGQPIDTRMLRESWKVIYESSEVALITVKPLAADPTPVIYAPFMELGFGPDGPINLLFLRGPYGGFHSVKLTKANIDKIVAEENKKFAAEDGR